METSNSKMLTVSYTTAMILILVYVPCSCACLPSFPYLFTCSVAQLWASIAATLTAG